MRSNPVFVLIQTGFIGDIALGLYSASLLKESIPSCTIVYVTIPIAEDLVVHAQHIDHVLIYDKRDKHKGISGILQIAKQLSKYTPEAIFCLHRSFRTALLSVLTHCTHRIGFTISPGSFLYSQSVQYRKNCHEIERNQDLIESYIKGVSLQKITPMINIEQSYLLNIDSEQGIIVIAPGSAWNTKRWPDTHICSLITLLIEQTEYSIVLIGSKQDKDLCQRSIPFEHKRIHNVAGLLSLTQTVSLLAKSNVLISNDSAPVHLASLANCPTIALFGPTHPAFGFGPLAKKSLIVQKDLPCRPCSIHGQKECPLQHHACMETIEPEEVLVNVLEILSHTQSHPRNP